MSPRCAPGVELACSFRPNSMLPRTVSHGNTPYSWKITPRSGPGLVTGLPSSSTRPFVGCTKPPRMFIIVVLPQPEGPMTETNSPCAMSKLTPSTTRIGPSAVSKSTTTSSKRTALIRKPPSCGLRRYEPSERPCGSCDAVLPRDQFARREAQQQVHHQRDQADADDAHVDDVELEARRRVLDQRTQPLLRGDQLRRDQCGPRDAERDTDGREDVRHRERHDDLGEDLGVARAERARDLHEDRAD